MIKIYIDFDQPQNKLLKNLRNRTETCEKDHTSIIWSLRYKRLLNLAQKEQLQNNGLVIYWFLFIWIT